MPSLDERIKDKINTTLNMMVIIPTVVALFFQVFQPESARLALPYFGLTVIWVFIYLLSVHDKSEWTKERINLFINWTLILSSFSLVHLSLMGSLVYENYLNNHNMISELIKLIFALSLSGIWVFSGLTLGFLLFNYLRRFIK